MDRRLTPATDRVAHESLRGKIERPAYSAGEAKRVAVSLADLRSAPAGTLDRQLWFGEEFMLIDRQGGWAFGLSGKDGYCGWLEQATLGETVEATHWVASPGTHLYPRPDSLSGAAMPLHQGSRIRVTGQAGKFAETPDGFVPARHLRRLGDWFSDPVAVAEGLLHSPYLWGGNSRHGIDCSGLVQLAWLACGASVPGDADLQFAALTPIEAAEARRGDLAFWKGHVAILVEPERFIHANGGAMAVAYEGREETIARIRKIGEGEVIGWRRV